VGAALNPISYVTGTLGSGKSYYSMRKVFEYLAAGKVVATNFDLIGSWWKSVANQGGLVSRFGGRDPLEFYSRQMDIRSRAYRYDVPDDLYGFDLPGDPDREDRGLLVIDEGALRLNARNSRDRLNESERRHGHKLKELEFYVNMRKLGWTCIILAHSSKMLDGQIQDLGGAEVRLRNFARVRMPLVGIPMSKNPRFLAVHYWPEVRAITGREFYGLDLSIARHYRSMERFSAGDDAVSGGLRLHSPGRRLSRAVETFEEWEERQANRRVPVWKRPELVGAATTRRMSTGEPAPIDDDDDARSGASTEEEGRASRAQDDEEELPRWLDEDPSGIGAVLVAPPECATECTDAPSFGVRSGVSS
jgi:hypothetical protein